MVIKTKMGQIPMSEARAEEFVSAWHRLSNQFLVVATEQRQLTEELAGLANACDAMRYVYESIMADYRGEET